MTDEGVQVSISSGGATLSSSAAYTTNGNLLASATDALGNVTNYSYDADTGVLEWVQLPEDSDSTRTEYTYDDMYRQASIVADTDSQLNLSANYTYTDEDLLATLQTPSTTYMFDYGDFDQRTAVRIGSRTLVSYAYDSKKQLDRLTYGNNDFVDNDYDAKGRLIKQTYETGETVEYAYDNSGNLATVTDSATGITTTYYYDLLDRQVGYREKSATLDHSVTCIYNEDNQVSSVTEVINGATTTYTYTYDEDNRVTNVAIGDLMVSYSYDGFGRLASRTVKNGDTVIQSSTPAYSAGKEANTTTGQISQYNGYTYTYDKNGNILSVTDGTYTTSYEYDSANQLTRENNQQLGFTHTWTYDNGGNITGRSEYPYTVGTLGTPTNTVAYTYKSSTIWGDMIDSYGTSDYLPHDGAGNLRYDGTWIYNWENGRELVSMTQGETAWTFSYDANGMRTKRTDGTAQSTYTYVYDGSQLVQMAVDGYTLDFLYDANGTPLAFSMGSMSFYYDTNLQGDVVAIRDTSGNVLVRYAYDAWGNFEIIQNHQIAEYNPLLYRGYVYDHEIGLYYLQSRYYDPEWGRFINCDVYAATGQGLIGNNMFVYCCNSPIKYLDTSGQRMEINDRYMLGGDFYTSVERGIKKNKDAILAAAAQYNVDPYVLAGCIYVEQQYNYNWVDDLTDVGLFFLDTSVGISQIRISNVLLLEELHYIEPSEFGFMKELCIAIKLQEDDVYSINCAAAYLAYLRDQWSPYYDVSLSPAIWGTLYNNGVGNPHSNPKPSIFGQRVANAIWHMEILLK